MDKLQKAEKEIKKQNPKLYKETNEKFVGRVESLLFHICGCTKERAIEVLEETIKKIKDDKNGQ